MDSAVTAFLTFLGVLLTAVGLYFAYNHRRQVQLQITQNRLKAYAGLWELMKPASPMRLPNSKGSISKEERFRMFDEMTNWYFGQGRGMLLESQTREMYLKAKSNLTCDDDLLQPLPSGVVTEQRRSQMSIGQPSLLRSQMKTDIGVYGTPFHENLSDEDEDFLRACHADLSRPPWAKPLHTRVEQRISAFWRGIMASAASRAGDKNRLPASGGHSGQPP